MSDQELIPEPKLTALLELEAEKVEESLDLWKVIEKQVTANQAANLPEPADFQSIDTVPDSLETGRKVLTFPRMLKYGLGIAAVLAIAFIIGTAIQPDKPDGGKDPLANAGPSKPPNTIPGTVAVVPAATPSVRMLSASLKATLTGASAEVRAVGWKQDGTQIAAASDDATLTTWDANGKFLGNSGMPGIKPPLAWPYRVIWLNGGLGFEADSSQVAAPNGNLTAYRVSESEFQLQKTMGIGAGETVEPQPTVAPGSDPQNNVLATLSVPGGVIDQLAWSPNGKYIAASGQTAVPGGFGDIRVWIWKVDGTLLSTIMNYNYPINSLAWSPDSNYLAVAAKGNNQAGVWTADGTQIADFKGDFVIWDLAWSPDGQNLAAAGSDNAVRIYWNISWGGDAYKLTLTGHQDSVWAVAWSPDGRTLASGSSDKTVRLWTVK